MEDNFIAEFSDDLVRPSVEKRKLSRMQKREERCTHGLKRAKDWSNSGSRLLGEVLEVSVAELQQLQETDKGLDGIMEWVGFFNRNGMLYRYWVTRGQPEGAAKIN